MFTANSVRAPGKALQSRNLLVGASGSGTPGIDPGFLPRQSHGGRCGDQARSVGAGVCHGDRRAGSQLVQ